MISDHLAGDVRRDTATCSALVGLFRSFHTPASFFSELISLSMHVCDFCNAANQLLHGGLDKSKSATRLMLLLRPSASEKSSRGAVLQCPGVNDRRLLR